LSSLYPALFFDKIYTLWNYQVSTIQKKLKTKFISFGKKVDFLIRIICHPPQKPFCIIMPPTNANGNLHAGHALVMTIEDIMTRYKRMQGYKALWLPGLDHAGFETQVVYEKKLEKEGRSRFKMSKEELYKEIWDFTAENKTNIKSQVKK
jgi:valyl-tRNA synthetase